MVAPENKGVVKAVYTPLEVKAILGIGKNETYRLIGSGAFPVVKVGRRLIVPKEPFHEWLNKGNA